MCNNGTGNDGNTGNGHRHNKGKFLTISILAMIFFVLLMDVFCVFAACCPGVVAGWFGGEKTANTVAAEITDASVVTTAPETTTAPEATTAPEDTTAPQTTTAPEATTAPETTVTPEQVQAAAEGGLEAALIATGLSMIGIAISVWAALNISNVLERKEIDGLYDEMDELQEKNEKKLTEFTSDQEKKLQVLETQFKQTAEDYEKIRTNAENLSKDQKADIQKLQTELRTWQTRQQENNRNQFLMELLKSERDVATDAIVKTVLDLKDPYSIPFAKLVRLEQYFVQVYQFHESGNSSDLLVKAANEGIQYAIDLQNACSWTTPDQQKIEKYIFFRIGEFNFYKLYCKGVDVEQTAKSAISNYLRGMAFFDAYIPEFFWKFDYPKSRCVVCEKDIVLSAYMCNTLGETYSNAVFYGKLDDVTKEDYGKRAIFFCAHAVAWSKQEKERYVRNLACALERAHGRRANCGKLVKPIQNLYDRCIELSVKGKHISDKTLYAYLSFERKWFNAMLERVKTLREKDNWEYAYAELRKKADPDRSLRAWHYASVAKELYGGNLVYRKFYAFTLRNCCIWALADIPCQKSAAQWYNALTEEFETLKVFYPDKSDWDDYMKELDTYVKELGGYVG